MTVKLGMTHAQLINAINSDIDLIKDQGSKIITKEFPASETETSSVQLDTKCQGKDYMFVFMDYGILEPSNYSLSADGLTVNFSPAIPANHKLLVRYFSYINLATIPNGLFLGQIIQVPFGIDESKNIGRYLNGQVIIQEQFPAFTAEVKSWVSTRSSLFTTETEWQQIKSSSKLGQCGKFVVDDTAGTIRLPCVVNAQGLVDLALIGGIKSESLPNITGTFNGGSTINGNPNTGAFYWVSKTNTGAGYANTQAQDIIGGFDASRSSSAYQNNAPVQQEAVQYPYCIVVNTGVEESDRPINNYQVNNVYSYGMSQYYKGAMNNNSWLKSAGQWNDGTVYTGMYNWLLEQMNAGVSGFVASTGEYTDYDFVINTADQTFRLPLLDGSEDLSSNKHEILTYTSDKTYVAPANGWFSCYGSSTAASASSYNLLINQTTGERDTKYSVTSNTRLDVSLEVSRGQSVYALSQNLTVEDFRFIYAQGNGSLYYYVGDTLQNADLINVARIEETLVTKTNKVQAAEASMPSSRYINLTLGASGSTYTAPANGWFYFLGRWENAIPYLQMRNITISGLEPRVQTCGASATGYWGLYMPVRSGDYIKIYYNTTPTNVSFAFIYAQGEQ